MTLDGETAISLDGIPGQDLSRRLLIVHEDQILTLIFSPLNPEDEAGLEALYTQVVDSLLNVGRPRLFIEVTDAGDKTAADFADELLAELGPGFDVERTFCLTVGYEIAELLDNMPGQDINRVVLVTHDGRLYKLTFIPSSEDAGEVYEEMESLYDLVVKSFRFLP